MERVEKAFEFAIETSKQLIALVTGVLTFSITFSEKMGVEARNASMGRWLLALTWLVYTVSVVCGVWMQLGITTVLQPKDKPNPIPEEPDIRDPKIKNPFRWQIITFAFGTLLALAFGVWRIAEPQKSVQPKEAPAACQVEQWFVGAPDEQRPCRTTQRSSGRTPH